MDSLSRGNFMVAASPARRLQQSSPTKPPSKAPAIYVSPTKRNHILRRPDENDKSFEKARQTHGNYSFIGQVKDEPRALEPRLNDSKDNVNMRLYSRPSMSTPYSPTAVKRLKIDPSPCKSKKQVRFQIHGDDTEDFEVVEIFEDKEQLKAADQGTEKSANSSVLQTVKELQELVLRMAQEHRKQILAMEQKVQQLETRISSLECDKASGEASEQVAGQ